MDSQSKEHTLKVDHIAVDIDITVPEISVFRLIKSYIYAIKKYGKDKVKVYVTPSRRGFRIYIEQEVDILTNLLERAIMDDDPYRILYSLKRFAMTYNPEDIDIEFYQKYYVHAGRKNSIIEIDMKDILGEELLKKLELFYGTKEFENLLKEHIGKILEKLMNYLEKLQVLYVVAPSKNLTDIIEKLNEERARYKVFADPYDPNNVIIRIVHTDLNKILDKISGYIKKYRIMEEVSKS